MQTNNSNLFNVDGKKRVLEHIENDIIDRSALLATMYALVEDLKIEQQKAGVPLSGVILLDDEKFSIRIIRTDFIEGLRKNWPVVVDIFEIIKHFSH